jgi:peptidoglycan-associated lipoprotein
MRFPTSLIVCTLSLALMLGCSKSAPYASAPAPPPPSNPARPEASFSASAESIQPGDPVQLQWTSRNATEAVIEPGGGAVALSGTLQVMPTADTTYTLWLKGPGGENTATARVAVRRAAPLSTATGDDNANGRGRRLFSGTFEEEVAARLQDIYFDYDSMSIRPDQQATLEDNARTLRALFEEFTTGRVIVEGHCDERGSSEYNLALGDRRARAIVDYIGQQGVPLGRVMLVGYGEERLACTQANEACYQLNRRGHFNSQP